MTEEKRLPTSSPPIVRAICNTLCDNDVDVLRDTDMDRAVTVLIRAGWSVKTINEHLEAALQMAAIRQRNSELRRYRKLFT